MVRLPKILTLFMFSAALSGCVEKSILDDIVLVNGLGFDYCDGVNIQATVVYPDYLPDQPPKDKTFTGRARMNKTVLQDISRQTTHPVVTGSINTVVFGRELAEKQGILDLVDSFHRDPRVGSTIFLGVIDGTAKEFLKGKYGIRSTGEHVAKIIEHNIKHEDLPRTNMQRFFSDYYQTGKTPFMPLLRKTEAGNVELTGITFFKYGKIADSIPAEKMFFFKLLSDKYSEGLHSVKTKEGEASVRDIRSSHDFILLQQNPLKIRVKIKVNGIIDEFNGEELNPSTVKSVEKEFEKIIYEECMELISRFQEKEIDPIGFGQFAKTQIRNFDMENWLSTLYKDLSVDIKPKVTITETGVIE